MPFDVSNLHRPRIAVIGSGISGLSAAHALSQSAAVTLFEAEPRLGGHARTVMAGRRGDQPVDTGFIVFNHANYPNLTALFDDLDVPVEKSDMSFGVSAEGGRLEYALTSLNALFAQRRNIADPRFLGLVADILRFNKRAEAAASSDDLTINDLVRVLGLGDWFHRYYLLPMSGAIWSTPSDEIGNFPARTLVQFFRNHALMSLRGQHQWWTVSGGSIEYVRRLEAALRKRGVDLRTGCPVRHVHRDAGRVFIRTETGAEAPFDHVVFATHADVTLRLLSQPSLRERVALSGVRYQDNHAFLHCDPSQMPRRRACWASWVYQSDARGDGAGIGVSYWMNRLQNIPEDDPMFVTLNPVRPIRDAAIYDSATFRHPVFDRRALSAQQEIADLQGTRNTWYAGAWLRHGFHEDGIASGFNVARSIERLRVRAQGAA